MAHPGNIYFIKIYLQLNLNLSILKYAGDVNIRLSNHPFMPILGITYVGKAASFRGTAIGEG